MMKNFALAPLTLAVFSIFPVAHAADTALGEITVTATREGQLISETPATVGVIKEKALRDTKPTHPSEIMGQVAGVWVNVTGGEGHQTAIRQPLTTNPGLSLSRRWCANPLHRLLQPQRPVRGEPADGWRHRDQQGAG